MARKYRTRPTLLAKLAEPALRMIGLHGPIVADRLAMLIHLTGAGHADPREARRRVIRDVVAWLRERGELICANTTIGYWRARNLGEWRAYRDAEKVGAVFKFVRLARESEAATDRMSRQGRLFENTEETAWAFA